MTNADTRQELADAVSTVAGLTGYVKRPSTPKDGDAWPQWRGARVQGGVIYENTWTVLVLLPGDDVKADEWADQYLDLLFVAVSPAMSIDSIEPAVVRANDTDTNALMITGRCE
jgi:hypothetical protein